MAVVKLCDKCGAQLIQGEDYIDLEYNKASLSSKLTMPHTTTYCLDCFEKEFGKGSVSKARKTTI